MIPQTDRAVEPMWHRHSLHPSDTSRRVDVLIFRLLTNYLPVDQYPPVLSDDLSMPQRRPIPRRLVYGLGSRRNTGPRTPLYDQPNRDVCELCDSRQTRSEVRERERRYGLPDCGSSIYEAALTHGRIMLAHLCAS